MSRGLNKVQIIGHLGKDPEMRYTPSGKPVTTFSVAVSRSWNSADGERHNETEWFNVVAWGNLAEICKQYLVASEMMMLGDRRDSNNHSQEVDGASADPTNGVAEDEFPF